MGCLSFDISIKPIGRMVIGENSHHLSIGLSCDIGNMVVEDEGKHLDMDVLVKRTGSMNIGFICTTDVGLPVLYASDGALITIDGKYLIVQK